MALSPRLLALRGRYHHHKIVLDVGCDHGKLGLSFLKEREVEKIHLIDPSSLVIAQLSKNIGAYTPVERNRIHIHREKGQDFIPSSEKKIIFIAGMGGKEIIEIITHFKRFISKEDQLVLSPHRDILLLREFLHASTFTLMDEQLVSDEGRFYQVISLGIGGEKSVSLYGENIWRGEVGEKYLEYQTEVFSAHQDVRSRGYLQFLKGLTQCF